MAEDLEAAVGEAEAAILEQLRIKFPQVSLKRIGPTPFSARWESWIVTPSDGLRDSIARDGAFLAKLKQKAKKAGSLPDVMVVQSQETVDRDFEGSWFNAMR